MRAQAFANDELQPPPRAAAPGADGDAAPPIRRRRSRRLVLPGEFAIGALLVAAALLKFDALVSGTFPLAVLKTIHAPRFLWHVLVVVEGLAGAALITGLNPPAVGRALSLLFLVFAIVAAVETWSGIQSCGCFGAARIPPWVMVLVDGAAALFLTVSRRVPRRPMPSRFGAFVVVVSAMSVLGMLVRQRVVRYGEIAANDAATSSGTAVLLEPETWVGQSFPLAKHIDVGDQISHGEWLVLFVRPGCNQCAAAIPRYVAAVERETVRLAIVELPGSGAAGGSPPSRSGDVLYGRLEPSRRWLTTTPVAVSLSRGIVVYVAQGSAAAVPDPTWWVGR